MFCATPRCCFLCAFPKLGGTGSTTPHLHREVQRCQRTSYPTSLMCVTVALSGARGMDLHARHPSIARKPRNSNTVSDWAAGGTCNKCRRRGEREVGDKCFELLHRCFLARASFLVRCGTYVTPDLLWYSCVVSGFSMALAVSPVLWTR